MEEMLTMKTTKTSKKYNVSNWAAFILVSLATGAVLSGHGIWTCILVLLAAFFLHNNISFQVETERETVENDDNKKG